MPRDCLTLMIARTLRNAHGRGGVPRFLSSAAGLTIRGRLFACSRGHLPDKICWTGYSSYRRILYELPANCAHSEEPTQRFPLTVGPPIGFVFDLGAFLGGGGGLSGTGGLNFWSSIACSLSDSSDGPQPETAAIRPAAAKAKPIDRPCRIVNLHKFDVSGRRDVEPVIRQTVFPRKTRLGAAELGLAAGLVE